MPEPAPVATPMSSKLSKGEGCVIFLWALAMLYGGVLLAATGLFKVSQDRHNLITWFAAAAGVLLVAGIPFLFTRRPIVSIFQVIAAVPALAASVTYVLGWSWPALIGPGLVSVLVPGMVMEFIIMHASVMMSAMGRETSGRWPQQRVFWIAIGAYLVMAAGISAGTKNSWLFVCFLVLVLNRIAGDVLCPAAVYAERRKENMARWSMSALFYIGFIFLTLIPLPRLAASGGGDGEGLWNQHPQAALAFGALYFAANGLFELYLTGHARNLPEPPSA